MTSPARGKGRPTLTQVAEIDSAIREAALKVLLEHGEAATMNAVARAAGLSRKSVYARYPNKDRLFLDVISDALASATPLEFDATGSAQDRLLHYVQAALDAIATPMSQAFQRLLTMNSVYMEALRAEILDATHKTFFLPLLDLLRDAGRKGEFIMDDPEQTAGLIVKLIFAERTGSERTGGFWLEPMEQGSYAAFVTRLIIRGLLPRLE